MSVMPFDRAIPDRIPIAAIKMIVLKPPVFDPIAKLKTRTMSLLTPKYRSKMESKKIRIIENR